MRCFYKFFLLCAAFVTCSMPAFADGSNVEAGAPRPKVALVLCGGGAKGAAHVGVLKVLEEAKMPIDMIVGTSIGGLVGGIYAMGYSADELDAIISNCDWEYLLSDNTDRRDASFTKKVKESKFLVKVPFYSLDVEDDPSLGKSPISRLPAGLIGGQNVLNMLNGLSVGYQESIYFGDLPIPFACIAADLATGKPVVLKEGILPVAMRATMAIPGVFAPVNMDGKVLVDGGILNNFPVDVAREMGADIVIGVDIKNDPPTLENLKSMPQVLNQMLGLMGNDTYVRNIKDVDILIKPDVTGYGTYSFTKKAVDQLMVNGYVAAKEKYDEIESLARRLNTLDLGVNDVEAPKATYVVRDTFCFKSVAIEGIEKENEHWLRRMSGLRPNVKLSGSDINRGVSILMGTGAFSSVNFVVVGKGTEDEELVVKVRKGPANLLALGARYDSEEAAAVLMHIGAGENNLLGNKLEFTGRLSYNPYGKIAYSYTSKDFPKVSFSYKIGSVDMNIYKSTANQNALSFVNQRMQLSLSNMYLRNFNFELGSRWEHFDFNKYLKTNIPDGYEEYSLYDSSYLSYYVRALMDSRDDYYYATRGMSFDAEVSYFHSNYKKGFDKFGSVSLAMNGVVRVTDNLAFVPHLYGRVVIGDCNEVPYMNYIGGTHPGRYFSQQMPFVGVNYANIVYNSAVIGRVDVRQRVAKRHYLYAIANYLRSDNSFEGLFTNNCMAQWGFGVKYSYDSPVGPLSLNVHWSDFDHRFGAYVSLGHYF